MWPSVNFSTTIHCNSTGKYVIAVNNAHKLDWLLTSVDVYIVLITANGIEDVEGSGNDVITVHDGRCG
jgi:hypothetical protein